MTIEHRVVTDRDLRMYAQIMNHLPTVFHRVALANLRNNACVEALHLKVERADFEVISRHDLSLLLLVKLCKNCAFDFL